MVDGQKYFCITRPRRFGKSVMANMIGAFFEKDLDGKDIFHKLEIARWSDYSEYLNKYNVIYILILAGLRETAEIMNSIFHVFRME